MTDPRATAALERAASVAAAWGDFDPTKKQYLEGWAEAVAALSQFFDGGEHMTSCNLSVLVGEDFADVTCSPFCREVRNAITAFITAMLGERDA